MGLASTLSNAYEYTSYLVGHNTNSMQYIQLSVYLSRRVFTRDWNEYTSYLVVLLDITLRGGSSLVTGTQER